MINVCRIKCFLTVAMTFKFSKVLSDKVEERTDELSKLSQMMNTDVVVLTHVNMKLTEMEEANKQLEAEVESGSEKIAKV